MQTQTFNNEKSPDTKLFIKMVLDGWETHNARCKKMLEALTDEQLFSETAPGRNRGIYLAGHLLAVSDAMLPLLGFCDRLYPHLEQLFLSSPDRSVAELPSTVELKQYGDEINARLSYYINQLLPGEWFEKHTAVSDEDFALEPHRNRLNVMINRTNHMSYHLGQLAYLIKKE
ncbi:MAG: DinB family protein [Ferruginibacter sp.]